MFNTNPGELGCSCMKLRQAARLVSRSYDAFLASSGISIGQFGILATLAAAEKLSLSALAELLQMERTTVTRNLRPLEKLGYIASCQGQDRRLRALSLSKAGRKALAGALPQWRQAQDDLQNRMGESGVAILHSALDNAVSHYAGPSTPERKEFS